MNILITSAGRRVSLVREFGKELRELLPDSRVYAGDARADLSAACRVADKQFRLPRLDHSDYMIFLEDLCQKEKISLVIPTIDTELKLLAEHREKFREYGIDLLVSDKELIEKCSDKRLTQKLFARLGIETPKLLDKSAPEFPVFVKPYDGSNSSDAILIKDETELTEDVLNNEKLMFFEYLDHNSHTEFTVDLYYDKQSVLKCVVPRERIEVRGGEVNKGITRRNEITEYVKTRLDLLKGARGCVTLQLFRNNKTGMIYGIEMNPRFGGGYPLSYEAGANFPKWIMQEYLLGQKVDEFDQWEENLLMLRYDDEVLIHDYESRQPGPGDI